ncbi:hypothetical protein BF93_16070 [Brachybacterium phenoliresistens]|uniref:Protein nucleotidyltransferase YdiU n=1 Tax=Brachybacterium phenoliresistens TaxID=396014 RepID=Z9JUI0_9MICO|nr:YdiU family protein [Brachybacterium phenoliresistens]EWS81678.1 hypothetical protein BF93_16070 [Brachybacterium phenoliresistens]
MSTPSASPTRTAPPLRQSYAAAVPELSVPWRAEAMPDPRMVLLNQDLARELGLDPEHLRSPEGLALLTGATDLPTTAQAYGGHQFGSPNPHLGDGRALLLGDLVDTRGQQRDLHLKGSGRTPFSRAGDGRAPLRPMLREMVIGEALHALGIPTTRALAVLTTGERIQRHDPAPEQGALLVRVAASHLRVGTVQYAAWTQEPDVLASLVRYAIARHHPAAADAEVPALALLEAVAEAQASLLAQWMCAGFVHGVMNTDNMTLPGESIDFGPCAFLDVHDPRAVFSSIDRGGRYAYGNQPGIALWNLSRLAEALLPLIDAVPDAAVDAATAVLEGFEGAYRTAWSHRMRAKLGLREDAPEEQVLDLGAELLDLLAARGEDRTEFFRALAEGGGAADPALSAWEARRLALAGTSAAKRAASTARMLAANPVVIPRNHALDAALDAAEGGDLAPVERILEAVRDPFVRRPGLEDLETAPAGSPGFITYCGT